MDNLWEIPKPNKTFILAIAVLGGTLVNFLILTFALLVNPGFNYDLGNIMFISSSRTLTGLVAISTLYFLLEIFIRRKAISRKLLFIFLIPACYVTSFLWVFLMAIFSYLIKAEPIDFDQLYFIKAFSFIYIVAAFAGLYFLIDHWLNLKKQKEMTRKATNLASEAQLQMLRYQVNPHFLFNALNTIRSMVEEDKAVARNMITMLSDFFRYSLSQNGTTDTLENEINAIRNYLDIQKFRFEEKLDVSFDIDSRLSHIRIPFFIILPLVENAVKYGLQSNRAPLRIKISVNAGDDLEISVHNTGRLVDNSANGESTKTGIENTKKRLALYFRENYSFRLVEKESWVIAQIIIFDYKKQLKEP